MPIYMNLDTAYFKAKQLGLHTECLEFLLQVRNELYARWNARHEEFVRLLSEGRAHREPNEFPAEQNPTITDIKNTYATKYGKDINFEEIVETHTEYTDPSRPWEIFGISPSITPNPKYIPVNVETVVSTHVFEDGSILRIKCRKDGLFQHRDRNTDWWGFIDLNAALLRPEPLDTRTENRAPCAW